MRPLASLLRDAGPSDSLAPTVRALLDSGFVVTVRDDRGNLVQLSEMAAEALGISEDLRGQEFWHSARFFDRSGRELAPTAYPAQKVRITGQPIRGQVIGLRSKSGAELWMVMSWLPLERGAAGWSVLSIGAPLASDIFTPPTRQATVDPVVAFALDVAGRRFGVDDLARRLRPAAAALAPLATTVLLWRQDETLRLVPVYSREGAAPTSITEMPLKGDTAARWAMTGTYLKLDLSETDIIGNRVIVEYADPFRTLALVPVVDLDGVRTASLSVTLPVKHGLSRSQIEAFEHLGRLAGAAFESPWRSAAAA